MGYHFIVLFSFLFVCATHAQNTAPLIPAQGNTGLSFPNQGSALNNLNNNINSIQAGGLQPRSNVLPNSNAISLQSMGLGQTSATQLGTSQTGMQRSAIPTSNQLFFGAGTNIPGGQTNLAGQTNFPNLAGQSNVPNLAGQNIPGAFGNIGQPGLQNNVGMQSGVNNIPGMGMSTAGGFQNIPGNTGFNMMGVNRQPGMQNFGGRPGFTGQPGFPGANVGFPGGPSGLFSQGCHTTGCGTGQQCVYTPTAFGPNQPTTYMCPTWIPVLPCQCRAGCRAQNQFIPFGQSRQVDQCGNICTCTGNTGQAACTMRACPQTGRK